MFVVAMTACAVAGCFADRYADEVGAEDERVMRAMVAISCQFGIDLRQRLAREARWPRGKICPMVRVVGDSSITTVLAQDSRSWDHFISTFEGAHTLMRISLPVYSSDGKRAVIYTEGTCPYTCGAGFYHELEKTFAGWRITRSINAWMT